ncbi:MAG: hypothetical protein H7062_24940, partial [Candidatus Saccharimonas sp.]|nr:hypothetical protein [Planctomycetaceae bacterium]
MLKCPACNKRVLGQDLVTGICSHCGKNLAGSGDSSLLFEQRSGDPTSDTIDPFTVSGAADAGSAQTFVSDEIPENAQEALRDAVRSQSPQPPEAYGSEQTFLSNYVPDDSAHRPESAAGSEQTFLSDDFVDSSVASSIDSSESPLMTASSSHQMQKPDTGFDSGASDSDENASAQTFVSDEFGEDPSSTMASDG